MDQNTPRHSIGEAARLVGVSTDTLRRWEREGVFTPGRTPAGHRRYSDADISTLQTLTPRDRHRARIRAAMTRIRANA